MITMSRLRTDERTQAFAQRKVASGTSKLEGPPRHQAIHRS